MWNLRHVSASIRTDTGIDEQRQLPTTPSMRVAPSRRACRALLLVALLVVLPITCSIYTLTAPSVSLLRHWSAMESWQCLQGSSPCP